MIALRGITKKFDSLQVLKGIDLDIARGEVVSIVGPSGAGKTTLLQIMGSLERPDSGSVAYDGEEIFLLNDNRLARFRNRNIGFVFQSFHLIPSLNVADNVALPLAYRHGVSGKERDEKVAEVLTRLGLSHRMRHFPGQLSGGQCQRVAIARAIIGDPQIVLADEPTGNLDSTMGQEVMEILHALNKEDGRTIVMVTHNESQARMTDRIIRFFDGRQVE